MALSDYKITTAQVNAAHVGAQPNTLRGTAAQNKQAFDNYPDLITEHFNDLVDELDNEISATIDSDVLLLYTALGWTAE